MRPGPARGTTASAELTVDDSMTDTGVVTGAADGMPRIYGTLAMATAVAEVASALLAEHLEDGEIAVPARLDIIHRSPIPVGTHVVLEATVQMVEPTRVTCEVLARTPSGVAARASYEQEVVLRADWLRRVSEA